VFDTIKEVKKFGDEMQKTGLYDGREVEGAVIRCKRHGMDFMFKIKNEQYLMYREYREVTKALLECNDGSVRVIVPKRELRMQYKKTPLYVEWLRKCVIDKPEWFLQFKLQKGIIHVRQEFEKYCQENSL
jgi:tRNA splicing ligase